MVVVLGGGIAGLSAAYYALQRVPGASVHIIEASQRLGGWIQTTRTPDGLLLEHGPRTIRPVGDNGANTLNLIEQLGLEEQVRPIPRSHPAAKIRMVYAKGSLHALPSSLGALFKTNAPLSRPLASVVFNDLRAKQKTCDDESSYDFISRRLGQDVADYLISPLLCGVCAGDAHQISVKMLFRSLFETEQKYGSIFLGMIKKSLSNQSNKKPLVLGNLAQRSRQEKWSVYSLTNGLQTFPETIEQKLKENNVQIHLNDGCVGLKFDEHGVEMKLKSGKILKAKEVISSLPATQLSVLLAEQHPTLSQALAKIQFTTVGVVNLHYKGNVLPKPAFGFLFPPCEKMPLLGVIYDSVCFPNERNDTIVTAMMGGYWYHPQFTNASKEDLAHIAQECIAQILNIQAKPLLQNVSIQKDCIPQYTVGHYERLDQILNYIKTNNLPLHLAGSSYNGVGLNDVIISAYDAVNAICSKKLDKS